MEPTKTALEHGKMDSLRPIVRGGIVYARSRCHSSLMSLLGIESLPILARDTRLAKHIMCQSHVEDQRASPSDVLARSRYRAWIVRGRYLAKEICSKCKLIVNNLFQYKRHLA